MAARVLATAPERFALAGLSMGGYVALEIVRQAPARVVCLALLNTSAAPDSPELRRRREGLIALAERGAFKGVTPSLLPSLIAPHRLEDKLLTEAIMAMAARVGKAAFLRQQTAILGRGDLRETLDHVRCPTLVVGGRDDQLTPVPRQREIAAAIADADVCVLARCGHLSTLERPAAVNALMEAWLNTVSEDS